MESASFDYWSDREEIVDIEDEDNVGGGNEEPIYIPLPDPVDWFFTTWQVTRVYTTVDIHPLDEPVPDTFPLEIDTDPQCPVCECEENLLRLGCQHTICDSCIRKIEVKSCPTCREHISMKLVKRRK